MKKILSFLIAFILLLTPLYVFAAPTAKYTALTPPQIKTYSESVTENDIIYTFKVSSQSVLGEMVRMIFYNNCIESGMTHNDIAASGMNYLIHRTKDFCQVKPANGSVWKTVKLFNVPETIGENEVYTGNYQISYIKDILPVICTNSEDAEKYSDGFDFSIRFITASDNWNPEYEGTVFTFTKPGNTQDGLHGKGFGFVKYLLPKGAVNSADNPSYFFRPMNEDCPLSNPVRPGYIFDGWSVSDDKRVGSIPADTEFLTLSSHWIPKKYSINYVLTTNTEFPFGNADITKHPYQYTVGEKTDIPNVKCPIGGYDFAGWYETPDFSGQKISSITEDRVGDITLYAKWQSFEDRDAEIRKQKEEYIKRFGYGDVDNDGDVTAADAREILRASVKVITIQPSLLKRADYDNSGTVSADDARTTLRVSVGLDTLYDILTRNGVI